MIMLLEDTYTRYAFHVALFSPSFPLVVLIYELCGLLRTVCCRLKAIRLVLNWLGPNQAISIACDNSHHVHITLHLSLNRTQVQVHPQKLPF